MNGAPGMRTPGSCGDSRPVVLDLPVHQERLGHHVAQEPQPRHDGAEPGRLGDDVGEFDLQDIAGHGALDEDRPGQRMHRAGIERGKIGDGGARGDLAVEPIARFQCDLLALVDFHQRERCPDGSGCDHNSARRKAACLDRCEWRAWRHPSGPVACKHKNPNRPVYPLADGCEPCDVRH